MCEGYNRDFKVPILIFRPFNIYGPGQNENFLIPVILKQIAQKKIILKDSKPKRDYIYIADIVKAITLAIEYSFQNLEIINLGYGKSYSVKEIVELLCIFTNEKPNVKFSEETRQGEIMDTIASTSKLRAFFNWEPENDIQMGIKKLLNLS